MASKEDNSKDAISLDKAQSPNCLIIDDATDNDKNNSIIYLSLAKMEELALFRGDTVLVSSEKGRDTVCIVTGDQNCDDSKVCMSEVVRKNLGAMLSDVVTISPVDVPDGKVVHIIPLNHTVENVSGNLLDVYLERYFCGAYRPVKKGDVFLVRNRNNHPVKFKVVETDPAPYCIVNYETIVHCVADFPAENSWHSSQEDDSTIDSNDLWSDEDENIVAEVSPNDLCTFIEVNEPRLDKLIITLNISERHQDVDAAVYLDSDDINNIWSESHDFNDVGFDYDYWKHISDAVRNNKSLNAMKIQGIVEADFNPDAARCIETFYDGLRQNKSIRDFGLEVFPYSHTHPEFDLEHFTNHNTNLASLRFSSDELVSTDQGHAMSLAVNTVSATDFALDLSDCMLGDENFHQMMMSSCRNVKQLRLSCRELSHSLSVTWLIFNTSVLSVLFLVECNEEGVSFILSSLSRNITIRSLYLPETNEGLCSLLLCDCTSISSIHNSNHTMDMICINGRCYGSGDIRCDDIPGMISDCLVLNRNPNKMEVIREKIARYYFVGEFDISPFVNMHITLLPEVLCLIKGDRIGAILRLLKGIPELCNVSSRDVSVSERITTRSDAKRQKTDK